MVASDNDDDPIAAKLEAEQRWMDLVKHLAKQVDSAANPVAAHLRIATIYHDRFANMAEAIKSYERVLELEPENRPAFEHLRALFEKRRDWEKLLELEKGELDRTAPEKRPDKAVEVARFAAARVGKPDVTIYWWQRVLEYEPDHRQALAELAKSFERAERPMELATVLQQQAELAQGNDDLAAALRKLATVREEQLGDLEAARGTWNQLLAIAPTDAEAKRALARLETANGAPATSAAATERRTAPKPIADEPSVAGEPKPSLAAAIALTVLAITALVIYLMTR